MLVELLTDRINNKWEKVMRMRLTVNLSLFISFGKLGRLVFWTGFEYKIMRSFIV